MNVDNDMDMNSVKNNDSIRNTEIVVLHSPNDLKNDTKNNTKNVLKIVSKNDEKNNTNIIE